MSLQQFKYLKKSVFCCIFYFVTFSGYAQKYANEFLSIGVGARALGMSNAQAAISADANSSYWNPAGLLALEQTYNLALMHASYFKGIANFDYAGFAYKIDSANSLGVGIIRLGIDDIPDTRFLFDADGKLNYQNVRAFSAADYALLIAYAKKLPILGGLKVGGTAKILHRNVGEFASAWGFGLDFGLQAQISRWQIGLVARDLTGTYTAWRFNQKALAPVFVGTGNTIPKNRIETATPTLVADLARKFTLLSRTDQDGKAQTRIGLLLALGFNATFDGKRNTPIRTKFASIDPHFGLEADYIQTVFIRLGIGQIQRLKNFDGTHSTSARPTFGLGLRLKNWLLDYALTDPGNLDGIASSHSHIFSLKVAIPKKRYKTPRNDAR